MATNTKPLNLPTSLFDQIKREAADRDLSVADYLNEKLTTAEAPPPTPVLDDKVVGDYVLGYLNEADQHLVLDMCQDNGRAPIDYIISYCKLAADRGELSYLIDRTDDYDGPALESQLLQQTSTCTLATCGRSFTPTRRGQKFCSDECGQLAHMLEVRQRAAQRSALSDDAFTFAPASTPLLRAGQQVSASELAALRAEVAQLRLAQAAQPAGTADA